MMSNIFRALATCMFVWQSNGAVFRQSAHGHSVEFEATNISHPAPVERNYGQLSNVESDGLFDLPVHQVPWYSCQVVERTNQEKTCRPQNLNQRSGHVDDKEAHQVSNSGSGKKIIVWQTFAHATATPEAFHLHNAQYLPLGSEMRWVDDSMAAFMVRDIGVAWSRSIDSASDLDICSAYFNLRPGAFRADLWRALVLWQYGGLYLDHKLILATPFESVVDLNRQDLFWSPVSHTPSCSKMGFQCLWQGVAYTEKPKNSVIECIVKQIISSIADEKHDLVDIAPATAAAHPRFLSMYGQFSVLSVTGPSSWYFG